MVLKRKIMLIRHIKYFFVCILLFIYAHVVQADPPTRVARLSYLDAAVSVLPSGEDSWESATINRPLTMGDRLWADANARAELQLGTATMRIAAN